ncbi:hypothetical protein Plhal304r1_c013g0048721 [Plasmopara halstedii]
MPPPDVSMGTDTTRKALSACTTPKYLRPRRFGTKITNTLMPSVDNSAINTDDILTPPVIMAAAQEHFNQNHLSSSKKKSRADAKIWWGNNEEESDLLEDKTMTAMSMDTSSQADDGLPTIRFSESESKMEFGRTIWSVTPKELTELSKNTSALLTTESTQKLSFSSTKTGKQDYHNCVKEGAEEGKTHKIFKKYYGLPIIPFYESSRRYYPICWQNMFSNNALFDHTSSEASATKAGLLSPQAKIILSHDLDHGRSGLSANTAIFHPRQTCETNELIQLVDVPFTSKKVAPHMDWWPVTWILLLWSYYCNIVYSIFRTSRTGTHASDVE